MKKRNVELPLGSRQLFIEETDSESEGEIRVSFASSEPALMSIINNAGELETIYEELVISPEAMDLERVNRGKVSFLKDHRVFDTDSVIGKVIPNSVTFEGERAFARIQPSQADSARDALTKIAEGVIEGISFGYRRLEMEDTGRDIDGIRLFRTNRYMPYEVSTTPFPLDIDVGTQTRSGQKTYACEVNESPKVIRTSPIAVTRNMDDHESEKIAMSKKTEEAAVEAAGTGSGEEANRSANEQKVVVEVKASEAERSEKKTDEATPTAIDADAIRAEAKKEARDEYKQRSAEVGKIAKTLNFDEKWIEEKVDSDESLDAIRAEALDKLAESDSLKDVESRPSASRAQVASKDEDFIKAASDHLAKRTFPDKFKDLETDNSFADSGVFDIARLAIERSGVSTLGMTKTEIAKRAVDVGAQRTGAHTLSDFSEVIGLANNTLVLQGYNEVDVVYPEISTVMNLGDFDETTMIRGGTAPELLEVPEGADYELGTFGTGSEKIKLRTFARSVQFTRQLLISDQFDVIGRAALGYGRRARLKIEQETIGFLLKNGNLSDGRAIFNTTDGTLASTDAGITQASLAAVYNAYANLKDSEGLPISISPSILLVGTGTRWVEANTLLGNFAPTQASDVSLFRGQYRIIASNIIGSHTSQSGAWFAMASPSDFGDGLRIGYLNGVQTPTVDTDVNTRNGTTRSDIYIDFVPGVADRNFAIKNNGT